MFISKAQELRRKNLETHTQMTALSVKANSEGRTLNGDELVQWDKWDAEFEARLKEIAQHEKLDAREKDLARLDTRKAGREDGQIPEDLRGDGRHKVSAEARARDSRVLRAFASQPKDEWDDEVREEIKRASARLPKEIRALSALTGSAGAFTIAQSFMPELDRAMKSYSGIVDGCRVINTDDGSDLPWPKMTDVANAGHRLTENSAAATNVDPTFAQTILKSYVYTSDIILVPVPLLVDTEFDLETELFDAVAERIGRIFNTEATTGSGSSQPRGLITALVADTTVVTAAGASAITYNDIVSLEHAVDPAYRSQPGAAFMFHDNILQALKKIVDSNGRPLFMPANDTPGTPGTIMGRPYFVNQDMASTIATTNKTMVFGLLKKYIVRRAGPSILMRLSERYADAFQVGFVAFQRLEGQLVCGGTTAVRYLQQA